MPCQYFIRKHRIYLITEANSITTGAKVSCHFVTMKLNNLAFYFRLFCKDGEGGGRKEYIRFMQIF